jgi:hypothetical protein
MEPMVALSRPYELGWQVGLLRATILLALLLTNSGCSWFVKSTQHVLESQSAEAELTLPDGARALCPEDVAISAAALPAVAQSQNVGG